MPPKKEQKATLRDLTKDFYVPDNYLSADEDALIKNTFSGETGDKLIKILRKIFLPTALDPELPIEEMGKDVWMVDKDFAGMPVEQIKTIALARQDTIKFILGSLIELKIRANQKEESPQEKAARLAKDSSK